MHRFGSLRSVLLTHSFEGTLQLLLLLEPTPTPVQAFRQYLQLPRPLRKLLLLLFVLSSTSAAASTSAFRPLLHCTHRLSAQSGHPGARVDSASLLVGVVVLIGRGLV